MSDDSIFSFDDPLADFGGAELTWAANPDLQMEKAERMEARALLRREVKRQFKYETKIESATALAFMPGKGETIHIVSSGYFDHWTLIPVYCSLLGGRGLTFWGTTWTMNRENARDLLRLYDEQIVSEIHMFTGTYFKRRTPAVYSVLAKGLMARPGCAFTAFKNHTKITLLDNGDDTIVIEGSANYTENQNAENYTVSNDRALYEFHREWMSQVADHESRTTEKQVKARQANPNRRRFNPARRG